MHIAIDYLQSLLCSLTWTLTKSYKKKTKRKKPKKKKNTSIVAFWQCPGKRKPISWLVYCSFNIIVQQIIHITYTGVHLGLKKCENLSKLFVSIDWLESENCYLNKYLQLLKA